jgi:subtilisin-like proprotein convertase family protein
MKQFLLFSFAVASSISLSAQTFSSSPNAVINDYATTEYPIVVSGLSPAAIDTTIHGLESVCINLTHTWDSDMNIFIVAPDGTTGMLSLGNGGSDDNYTNTCFDQTASTPITQGTAPFTGVFKPQGQMGMVNNGQNGNGTWKLRITDTYPADNGTLISFSITFGNNPATYIPFVSSNLPIVVINTGSNSIQDEPKVMADMGIIFNGFAVRNYMTDSFNDYNGKIGIEYRGSSSQGMPKKSYGFETWDVNGNSIDSSLLGMPKESDWILSASYSDKSLLNNFMTYDLARSLGWYAPRCQHVELVINGEYQGVYVLMEKIKRDNNRVDIAKLQPTDIAGDELTGGYIVKIDKGTGNGGGGWTSNYAPDTNINGQTIFYQYDYPSDVNIVPQQEAYIQSYIDSFETALAGPNFRDTAVGYPHYIDVNSFVDYFLLNEISRNVDGYRLSTYLYKQKDSDGGKIVIGPCWDYDIAWGNADYCLGNDPTGWAIDFAEPCSGDYWQIPFWWDRLFQDTTFQNRVRCRWEELKQTALSVTYLHNFCDSMETYLTEGAGRNFVTWPILGTYVWPNPGPIPTSYPGEIAELKNWITLRSAWMDANMPGTLNGCNLTTVGSNAVGQEPVTTYPNPFTNEINFSVYLGKPDVITCTIYNALGQEVIVPVTTQGISGTNTVHIVMPADLPEGVYMLRVQSGENVWTQSLIKSNQ